MLTVTVNTFRRPFHTRLCLEHIARAWRWHPIASKIAVCLPYEAPDSMALAREISGVIERNPDVPWEIWDEPRQMTPHTVSKWMMDRAFAESRDVQGVLYVEDDAILSPDAFMLVDYVLQKGRAAYPMIGGAYNHSQTRILGCCLYHETIPEVYIPNPPDPRKLHASNGVNTHGGTLFLRKPYMEILSPNWNCKQVEPKGFDYSAHYLMYLNGLFMIYPDLSRSMNIGWSGGSLSQEQWAKYCGRSIWVHADNAVRDVSEFEWDGERPPRFMEEWMLPELKHREIVEGR